MKERGGSVQDKYIKVRSFSWILVAAEGKGSFGLNPGLEITSSGFQ